MIEEERWIMHGLPKEDPSCIKNVDDLAQYINQVGLLPLFRNDILGFSAEEHTAAEVWFSGDPDTDPWEWRKIIAERG